MFKLAEGSLKNRAFVALLSTVIFVLGIFALGTLRQELIPRVELPVINVISVSPGATSEQMHDRVSVPIEQQVSTIAEVSGTTTTSRSSVSIVTIELDYGTDIARATNRVEQQISRADDNFPEGLTYDVVSGGTSDIPLAYVAVTSDGTPLEVAERLRTTVVPALEQENGVASVQLLGAPEQRISITLDQARIAELGISADAVQQALEDNGLSVPVGSLVDGEESRDVTVGQEIDSVDALKQIPVVAGEAQPGQPATVYPLSDIADVELTQADAQMVGRLNGESALGIVIFPTANANIVQVTDQVNGVLDELAPAVGNNTQFTTLFTQAPFITGSIESLAQEGALGLIFAVLVILIFLTSIRSTLVTALSIPLSLLVGFIGMLVGGYSLNMLTLAALTLSIGRVVDDSIVVIENIKRHLEYGKPRREAILDAVQEVASAITASTVVSFIVFVPVGLVPGMVGELFRPFAFTVVIALAASLLVALTIVPVLAYWFLRPSKEAKAALESGEVVEFRRRAEEKEHRYWLHRAYEPALRGTQKHPAITLVAAVAILAATVALFPLLKINLLGGTNQGNVTVAQATAPGASMEAKVEQADATEAKISAIAGVESTAAMIGSSPMAMGGAGDTITYMISVDEKADITELTDAIVAAGDSVTGEGTTSDSSQSMLGSGTIDVNVTAPTPEALAAATEQINDAVAQLPEIKRAEHNASAITPAVQVNVNRDAAAAVGLTENAIVGMIAAQMVEPNIGQITIDNVDTSIYISIDESVTTIEALRAMTILGQPLEAFATVEEVDSLPTIVTINGQTTTTVSATPVDADNLGHATDAVKEAVAGLDLPDGTVTSMDGASQQLADSFNQLGLALAAAVLLIYVVLVWIFRSLVQPALLLVAIPFAAIGSFLALLITGTALDISAMIGLLMLTGIVVTNAVVLVDLMNQYREQGMDLASAVHDGAMRRVRPVAMTSLATIVAMIPMALGLSSSTGFISTPLAITVIGGLITSTLLTLILLPILYRLIEGVGERRRAKAGRD